MVDKNIFTILDVGAPDKKRAKELYPDAAHIRSLDLINGWNVMTMGFPRESFRYDVILANHFIEHVDDPDKFLEMCKENMTENTILDIGTPNLCAWFNRILFLFGYLPHSYEVSYRKGYGRAFNWNNEPMGGHLRVFSVPSLIQMLKYHEFRIISIKGEESFYPAYPIIKFIDRLFTRLSPSLASSFRVKCML